MQQPAGTNLVSGGSNVNFGVSAQGIGVPLTFTVLNNGTAPLTISGATIDGATSFASFVSDGIFHIWHGLDHCLFLLCLILPAVFQRPGARWR